MQDLLRKIESNAQARLGMEPDGPSARGLAEYQAFLKVETHRLRIRHRAGGGGLQIAQARAVVIDWLLRHLWEAARQKLSEQSRREFPRIALAAIGGYGRGELNPHSDIDFMFLHDGQVAASKPLPVLARMLDGILYPLYDLHLKVGHCVRSSDDCVKVANSDMQSKTSLIEARLIAGNADLFAKFEAALLRKCVQGHEEEYIQMRLRDQAARRAKFGNSATMQEPNLKNGCGGLRDYQNLLWMAYFKYRTRSLEDLHKRKMMSESERKQLTAAYDYLLRARTEMHYHLNRGMDVLTKNVQPVVAYNLGYRERSRSQRIERFMRDVYTHSRNIFLITRTVEQRLALLPEPGKLSLRAWFPSSKRAAPPVDGFKFVNGQIVASNDSVFREEPRRLIRVFLHAQQRGLRLHPDLAQLIRNQIQFVDRSFQSDEHVRDTFLEILNQRGNVAPVLRTMHEVDFLGKYLPEFGKLTCLVQHEFYHQYTADEHTLVCLDQLDRVWGAEEPMRRAYSELFHKVERPFLLYLALLLHDVGKAAPEAKHTDASVQMALRAARRLRLDAAATHTLEVLIKHHLLLASISQRRDLDDPAVIRHVARLVENPENLALLTLHTFVDSQATSDKLWNGFKDSLLWTLHQKTMHLLTGGPGLARVEEQQRGQMREQVQKVLKEPISSEEMEAHFQTLPPRYFQVHSPKEVAEDLAVAHEFMRLQITEDAEGGLHPIVRWRDDQDRACNTVKVSTWDRAGLFNKVAGCFSAVGLSILSAQVFTRRDGIVLDTFSVVDARTGSLAGPEQRKRFQELLQRVLLGTDTDLDALIARQKTSGRALADAYAGDRLGTEIRFDNEASDDRSLVEIQTEDRVGLLYAISQTLSELALDIAGAKISTEKGAAIDTFYLRELDGRKVASSERQRAIERRLRAAISRLEG